MLRFIIISFALILVLATVALSAEVPPSNSVWIEGHWGEAEGQRVWVPGYWKVQQKEQPQQPKVVYVYQQPTVIYVQQPQVVVYREYSNFAPPIYSYGYFGHSCYNHHHRSGVSFSGSFVFRR